MIPTIRNALQMASNNISLISNNLANASTTAFKRSEGEFLHSYAEDIPREGLNVGYGAISEGARRQFDQGSLKVTNGSLDVAVNGLGMFQTVSEVDGDVTYTRDGSFIMDTVGFLKTTDGRRVLDVNGDPLVIPPRRIYQNGSEAILDTIQISSKGQIQATYGDGTIMELGTFGLARFGNLTALKAIGNGHYVASERSGPAIIGGAMTSNFGQLINGHLEASNTNVTDELAKLMKAQQAYSGSSRMLQTAADITKRLIG